MIHHNVQQLIPAFQIEDDMQVEGRRIHGVTKAATSVSFYADDEHYTLGEHDKVRVTFPYAIKAGDLKEGQEIMASDKVALNVHNVLTTHNTMRFVLIDGDVKTDVTVDKNDYLEIPAP